MKVITKLQDAVALALALCAGVAGATEPTAIKDFVRKTEFLSAKISPTGEFLAVAMPVEQQTMVGIIDLKNKKVSGHLRFADGEHVADFWWVGPKRIVASVAKSFGPLDQPGLTGELYGIDADGQNRRYLFGLRAPDRVGTKIKRNVFSEYASAYVVDPLVDEPEWALIVVIPWVYKGEEALSILQRINVYTGQRVRVTVVPGTFPLDAVSDRAGRPRFAYGSNRDGEIRLYAKANTSAGWSEVQHPGGLAQEVELHGATADGTSAYLTTGDARGRTCLYEYSFAKGSLVERQCTQDGAVGQPIFSFDDSTLIGLLDEAGKPEVKFLQAKHPDARLLQLMARSFPGQRVQVTSRTQDSSKFVVLVSSDRNPGDFYLVDRATKKAEYLLSRRSWIDPSAMAPVSAITYKTRDGATIHAYLTATAGDATRKAPLVLVPHGGPHGPRDFWEWEPWAQALASRGYAVLQPNFRGSGGYGYAHEFAGYRKWGTLMQDDLTDAVRWAIDQGIADPARICIMGGSYGGYSALMSATREPDLYRCAIGLAGAYDLVRQSEDSDTAEGRSGRNYLHKVLGDVATMRAQSPMTYVERLKIPVLIAHGTADERVPFSQAKQLRKALEKNKKTYEWLEYEDEEHGFWVDDNHEHFIIKALDFLDRHIGAGVSAAVPASAQTQ
ncbi:MAG TPA: S9 family peptidase [Verrucomicrobiae bacterium]|nr:S9 family peptidase [Verrucomicrobiae bacterium]